MSTTVAKALSCLVLATALASCASGPRAPQGASVEEELAQAAEPRTFEPWPPPAAFARTAVRAEPLSGETIRLEPKPGGFRVDELFEFVHGATGASILYDSANATFKTAKVEFVGPFEVPKERLFAWLQAVLAYRKLVLVPVGPKAPDGRQQWFVMDLADPNLKSRPVHIDESEVLEHADRDGLYVVTTLRLRDTVDPTRARNALSPLSTPTAGIGRIQDLGQGSRHLIVGDFAPVVAAMKRMLDIINAGTPPSAAQAQAAPQPAARPDK